MIPSRSEVKHWNPEKLADFLKKSRLHGCDRVVLHHRMTGERFMNLTENDLLKFPTTSTPMISKLRVDIQKQSGKRSLFSFGTSKPPQPVETEPDVGGWGPGEFDEDDAEFDEFDEDDYEEPGSEGEGDSDNYEDPEDDQDPNTNQTDWTQTQTESQTQIHHREEEQESDYEPPPSEPSDDFTQKLPPMTLGDSDYIDSHVSSRCPPPAVSPRPPLSTPYRASTETRRDASPHPQSLTKPAAKFPPQVPPQVCRANKPGRDPGSGLGPNRGTQKKQALKTPPSQSWSRPEQDHLETRTKASLRLPTPSSVNRSNSGARAPPHRVESRQDPSAEPDQDLKKNTFPFHNKSGRSGFTSTRHADSLPPGFTTTKRFPGGSSYPARPSPMPCPQGLDQDQDQDLDSRWYVGKVTRSEAEATLRRLGKDGAFLVRDSTKQSSVQPFTLMVLFQNKVYNVQIQIQDHRYLLGTGLKVQESFTDVRGIVDHFSQSPLLLIDAKKRDLDRQNQCVLSEPAGPYMDRV